MSTPHYIVFIGASPSLSTTLAVLVRRDEGVRLVAPAAKHSQRGITLQSISTAVDKLVAVMRADPIGNEVARLSLWAYAPSEFASFEAIWTAFGRAAWIEYIPANLKDKDEATRIYIEERIKLIKPLLHEVSHGVFKLRQSSRAPFCGELVIYPGDVQAAVLKRGMVHQELPVEDAAELHFGAAE